MKKIVTHIANANYIPLVLFLLLAWSVLDFWSVRIQLTLLILLLISLFIIPFFQGYHEAGLGKPKAEEKEEERTWWKDFGGAIYHIIISIGIGAGAKMHENDFGGLRFLWVSLVAGAVIGFMICRIIIFFYSDWSYLQQHKQQFYAEVIFAGIFLAACISPFINQYANDKPAICNSFIIEPSDRQKNTQSKYITVLTERGKERFEPPNRILSKLHNGDSVLELCIKKGRLGFDYVDEFRIPEKKDPND